MDDSNVHGNNQSPNDYAETSFISNSSSHHHESNHHQSPLISKEDSDLLRAHKPQEYSSFENSHNFHNRGPLRTDRNDLRGFNDSRNNPSSRDQSGEVTEKLHQGEYSNRDVLPGQGEGSREMGPVYGKQDTRSEIWKF